ncbi:MAG: orotidine-5'-phosphate decarboxylase [Fibrobacterota bacterium]|nr:orotidine-5'-phosphate decarboxylase [Fibrobacterota bacterium]QQS05932.1 MAG: orotidine-5'-phosphate decarboxylase [Fibrobacterota bacterium]
MATLSAKIGARTRAVGNNVCFGIDPILERIPLEGTPDQVVERFGLGFLEACLKRGVMPAAVKPNAAYYEALGPKAVDSLQKVCAAWREAGVFVVLDAKRGDIGKSSGAYAQAAFGPFCASAVTVAPYMGRDSVEPFLTSPEAAAYLLLRTSNPGARDFQDLMIDGEPLYLHVARKALSWAGAEKMGFVVGATAPQELESIAAWFVREGRQSSFLIPGVSVPGVAGGQGGGIDEVVRRLRAGGSDPWIHLVNASSGLNFAWERDGNRQAWAEAGACALEELAAIAGL